MDRINRTWELVGACMDVLMYRKSLLVFPIISAICSALVVASFIPFLDMGTIHHAVRSIPGGKHIYFNSHALSGAQLAVIFAFYLCNYFVINFFNTALTVCAMRFMRDEEVSVGDGLRTALQLSPRILAWSALSAVVGVLIRALESERLNIGVAIGALIFGVAFSLASYFAIPVMVLENLGPIDALKKSAKMFMGTWGDRFTATFSFGGLVIIAAVIGVIPLVLMFSLDSVPVRIVIVTLVAIWTLFAVLSITAMETIFRAALYVYASTGKTPDSFYEEDMKTAFTPRLTREGS